MLATLVTSHVGGGKAPQAPTMPETRVARNPEQIRAAPVNVIETRAADSRTPACFVATGGAFSLPDRAGTLTAEDGETPVRPTRGPGRSQRDEEVATRRGAFSTWAR